MQLVASKISQQEFANGIYELLANDLQGRQCMRASVVVSVW